jgi:hypothetical protein
MKKNNIVILLKIVALGFVFSYIAPCFAALPVINTIANASSLTGITYTAIPSLSAGSRVTWTKEYGPDDMTVDSSTGTVSWAIPSTQPRESFNLGVKASNADGSAIMSWVLTVGGGTVRYVGAGQTYTTISAACSAASSGDTIIIKDGTYTGNSNMMTNIGYGSLPPSGSSSGNGIYTTVIAEHPGEVLIDAESARTPIYGNGSYTARDSTKGSGTNVSYLAFHGLIASNPYDDGNSNGCITFNNCHHIKVIDCGASEAAQYTTPISLNRSGYILIEGCYSWGQGRMRIVAYLCDYII